MNIENNRNKIVKRLVIAALCLLLAMAIAFVAVISISSFVKNSVSDKIISTNSVSDLFDVDYVLVLGAGLRPDGTPSDMLADRLKTAFAVLEKAKSAKLLLSGDNSGEEYNEVAAMKKYAIESGIDESRIVEDGKGFSTYESVERALKEYSAQNIIIVTQEYHLYRALYIAQKLRINAHGVSADIRTYRGQFYREMREIIARNKDFFKVKNEIKAD